MTYGGFRSSGDAGPARKGVSRSSLVASARNVRERAWELVGSNSELAPLAEDNLRNLDGDLAVIAGILRDRLLDAKSPGPVLFRISNLLADVHTVRFSIHDFLAN